MNPTSTQKENARLAHPAQSGPKSVMVHRSVSIPASSTSATAPNTDTGISELILTPRSPSLSSLLLPMLAHLSRSQDRWITWIGPRPSHKQALMEFGVDIQKIRFINSQDDCRWLLWEALNSGTSHTVIASDLALSPSDFEHLEQAAHSGQCHALLIRTSD